MTSPKPSPEALERARELLEDPASLHGLSGTQEQVMDALHERHVERIAAALTAELERGKAEGARECAELAGEIGLLDSADCLAVASKYERGGE